MTTLVSTRLILTPVSNEDIPFLKEILGDPERTRYLFGGSTMGEVEAGAFIERYFTPWDAPTGMGVLRARDSGRALGFAGIIATDCLGIADYEFGFVLAKEAERQDFATEIGYTQMRYALEGLGLERILALVHPENSPSLHVIRDKLAMRECARIGETAYRGPRIVFCRERIPGLPIVQGRGWAP